jgi:hypothetical protein
MRCLVARHSLKLTLSSPPQQLAVADTIFDRGRSVARINNLRQLTEPLAYIGVRSAFHSTLSIDTPYPSTRASVFLYRRRDWPTADVAPQLQKNEITDLVTCHPEARGLDLNATSALGARQHPQPSEAWSHWNCLHRPLMARRISRTV